MTVHLRVLELSGCGNLAFDLCCWLHLTASLRTPPWFSWMKTILTLVSAMYIKMGLIYFIPLK